MNRRVSDWDPGVGCAEGAQYSENAVVGPRSPSTPSRKRISAAGALGVERIGGVPELPVMDGWPETSQAGIANFGRCYPSRTSPSTTNVVSLPAD